MVRVGRVEVNRANSRDKHRSRVNRVHNKGKDRDRHRHRSRGADPKETVTEEEVDPRVMVRDRVHLWVEV